MGAWIERHYSWTGLATRGEYRRWLPLILAVNALLLGAQLGYGADGYVDVDQFAWIGAPLALVGLVYYIGWFLLTARRLRSANISRGWMLLAFFAINFPVGDYHINVTWIAALLLTAVGALVPDHDPYSAG